MGLLLTSPQHLQIDHADNIIPVTLPPKLPAVHFDFLTLIVFDPYLLYPLTMNLNLYPIVTVRTVIGKTL
jgi:hypothetical protein